MVFLETMNSSKLKKLAFLSRLSKLSGIIKRSSSFCLKQPELDLGYLCDPNNRNEIMTNIRRRNSRGDLDLVVKLFKDMNNASPPDRIKLYDELINAAVAIPNKSHPDILPLGQEPKVVNLIGSERKFSHRPLTFEDISKKLNLVRTENLTNLTGPRSYFLLDQLALLEQALIDYTICRLLKQNFKMISVPDILNREVIEACGMETLGERNQVYSLDKRHGEDLCLSGTAEMGIARCLMNKKFRCTELPLRLAAVSRCFRAETSKVSEEKGIYRVHQFTKVEMFGVSMADTSCSLMEEFRRIQEENFASLELHLRTLDMPQEELGASAYRKYDVEAYMPGKKMWGELSSTSNCTDFQSRRLNIKSNEGVHLHTVNGTACAVPRLIISIVETHQNPDGTVRVPSVLVPYIGTEIIQRSKLPKLTPYKQRRDKIDCLVTH